MVRLRQRDVRSMLLLALIPGAAAFGQLNISTEGNPAFRPGFLDDRIYSKDWTTEREADVGKWIRELGHPSYERREDASAELALYMELGVPQIHAAFHRTDDTEVKMRIRELMRELYMAQNLYLKNGFLGVRIGGSLTHQDDPRIPVGGEGIRIDESVFDGGAYRAGIKRGDVIISLNGRLLRAGGPPNDKGTFSEIIRLSGAGAILRVKFLRGHRTMETDARLGPRRPNDFGRSGTLRIAEQRTFDAFHRWWTNEFVHETSKPPALEDEQLKLWEED